MPWSRISAKQAEELKQRARRLFDHNQSLVEENTWLRVRVHEFTCALRSGEVDGLDKTEAAAVMRRILGPHPGPGGDGR